MWYDRFDTPIGPLTVATDVDGLRHVLFASNRHEVHGQGAWLHSPGRLAEARRQFMEYFAGERREFDLPLRPVGTTFQLKAWQALAEIPYGETRTYAASARRTRCARSVPRTDAIRCRSCCPAIA
jgi:methylated-DNA-[protein]-cysteine S-methyltransferase